MARSVLKRASGTNLASVPRGDWVDEMNTLRRDSGFSESFSQYSFDVLLKELSFNPQTYPKYAQDILGDFLHRFVRTGAKVEPFYGFDEQMRIVQDPSVYVSRVIKTFEKYENRDGLDELYYLHKNRRLSVKKCLSFGEMLTSIHLPSNFPKTVAF